MNNLEAQAREEAFWDKAKDDVTKRFKASLHEYHKINKQRIQWREENTEEGRPNTKRLHEDNDFNIEAWRQKELDRGFLGEDRVKSVVRYWYQQVVKNDEI